MSKVILDMSMSLDGFISGVNDHSGQPLGEGGSILHNWLFSGETPSKYNDFFKMSASSQEVFDESFDTAGAIIVGKRTYDIVGGWGGSHPILGVPVFVLTHEVPLSVPVGSTPFTFVTDGIQSAVEQAKAVATNKNVGISGAAVAQQCIKARLLDEIHIHLVPVLLGNGIRLFDRIGTEQIKLECIDVIDSIGVTHLKYQVVK